MFSKLFLRAARLRGAEFCQSCGQQCTLACRAEARLEQTRTAIAYQAPFLH